MTSVEFSADLSSITGNSESGTSHSINTKSSTSSSPSQCSSSTSSEYHRGAVACAAVPETIMECESVLDKSSQPSYAPIDLIVDSDSSDASSDEMTDGSIDEEQRIKEELKTAKVHRKVVQAKAKERELKNKLREHQKSNTSQSSRGSNDRSRTRVYADHQQFDMSTPPGEGQGLSSFMDLTPPPPMPAAIPPMPELMFGYLGGSDLTVAPTGFQVLPPSDLTVAEMCVPISSCGIVDVSAEPAKPNSDAVSVATSCPQSENADPRIELPIVSTPFTVVERKKKQEKQAGYS
jgi:hypothetical protein